MDSWTGFGYFVFGVFFILFLPFMVSLFGREARWKLLSLLLCIVCIATPMLTASDVPMLLTWGSAWVFAGLAIRARAVESSP